MSRTTELDKEINKTRMLIVMKPRAHLAFGTWTLVSGTAFKQTFTFGKPATVSYSAIDATGATTFLTEATTSAVVSGEFFYDQDTSELFVNNGADITISGPTYSFFVAYEIYLSDFETNFNRIPTDSTSDLVYYEPLIINSPTITLLEENSFFGFLGGTSSAIIVRATDKIFNIHIQDNSFNNADIDFYHVVGGVETANIKKALSGRARNFTLSDNQLSFEIINSTSILDNQRDAVRYSATTFPDLDPNFIGKPIQEQFGFVYGVSPVNIDYVDQAPTTSDNRSHGFSRRLSGLSASSTTVGAGASTATKTFVVDIAGINVGDKVRLTRIAPPGTEYVEVLSVDFGAKSFTHGSITTALAVGDTVVRSAVGNVNILQGGIRYFPKFDRDYVTGVASSILNNITFFSTLESNLGMASTLSTSDEITLGIYGGQALPVVNATTIGSLDSQTATKNSNTNASPASLIATFLLEAGVPETEINEATFVTVDADLLASGGDKITVGFATPPNNGDEPETFREIITRILESTLTRLTRDIDGKWILTRIGLLGAPNILIDESDILSYNTSFDYEDIVQAVTTNHNISSLNYTRKESIAASKLNTTLNAEPLTIGLHLNNKEITLSSIATNDDVFQVARQILANLGTRRALLKIRLGAKFYDTNIDDVVQITRKDLPGFEFDKDIDRVRKYRVVGVVKNLDSVILTLDDQKGIEDNPNRFSTFEPPTRL